MGFAQAAVTWIHFWTAVFHAVNCTPRITYILQLSPQNTPPPAHIIWYRILTIFGKFLLQRRQSFLLVSTFPMARVADPHWFNADTDMDPGFFLIADPDPVLDPEFWWSKIEINSKLKKIIFFGSKISIYLSLGLYKGCPSYRRSLQPSKKNIQQFKTWNFFSFFVGHFCPPGSGSGSSNSN